MPVLLLLNGAPGIGKTSLGRRYVGGHPLALCLDLDPIRGSIGRWEEHLEESGLLARAMAVEMARVHLGSGHDVVVPQYVARADFPAQLSRAAAQARAEYVEVLLRAERGQALRRYRSRADDAGLAHHHTVADRVMGGVEGWSAMYSRIEQVARDRGPVVLDTAGRDVEETYEALLAVLRSNEPNSGPQRAGPELPAE